MQRKILLLVIVSILVVLVSIGLVSYMTVHGSIKHYLNEHLTLASLLGRNIDYILERNVTRLYDISFSGQVDLSDEDWTPEKNALKTAYEYSIFSDGLFLMDLDGNIMLRYPHKDEGMINLLGIPSIYDALHSGRTVVSDVYTLSPTQRKVIFVLVPLKDVNGEVVGLAGGEVNPANYLFTWVIRSLPMGKSTRVELIDSHGIIISSNDPERTLTFTDHDEFLGNLIAKKKPVVSRCHRCHETGRRDPEREADMMAFAPLSFAPWGVTVREPESQVFGPTTYLQNAFLIISLIIIAAAIVLSVGLSRSIIRPVQALSRASERIASGDLSVPVRVASSDEVGELADGFESMRIRLMESLERVRMHTEELEEKVQERTEELSRRKKQLATLLEEGMRTQEEERKRIARELHDETGQTLAAIGMSLEIASVALKRDRLEPEMILELREKVSSLMDGINRIIHDLRPPVLDDLGLESAIRWLLERHLAGRDIGYTITADGIGDARLGDRMELALFRVLQEAVINITKHSGAANVDITVEMEGKSMKIRVVDDGEGFDLDEVTRAHERGSEHGFGLMGMQERVTNLDGEMNISSEPGKGTSIEISIPAGGT